MRRLSLLGLAAASGLLLFAADFPLHLYLVQAVALVPLLAGLMRLARSTVDALLAGLVTALVMLVPLAVVLEFPLAMAVGLGAYMTVVWVLMTVGAYWVLRGPAPLGAFCAGAVAVAVEWIDFNLVPIWGTAQCFARVWSAEPWAVQIVELAGMLGLVFVVVSAQGLLAGALVDGRSRATHVVALVLLLAGVGGHAYYALHVRQPDGAVRVAAMGWTHGDLPRGRRTPPAEVLKIYRPLLDRAVRHRARLVVSPETGFRMAGEVKRWTLAELSDLARRHRVTLAVGYFDEDRNDNRIAFLGPAGERLGEYVKTHLIPTIERYRAGPGDLLTFLGPPMRPVDRRRPRRVRVGGMICQDDNFTDLSRRYGVRRVDVMAAPTNDWAQVKSYHLENSVFRAVESRYAVVRGASNGISAIVAPDGRVLTRADHFHDGPQVIVADVPVYSTGPTLYSRWGDWIALAALLGLVAAFPALRRRWARGREGTLRG